MPSGLHNPGWWSDLPTGVGEPNDPASDLIGQTTLSGPFANGDWWPDLDVPLLPLLLPPETAPVSTAVDAAPVNNGATVITNDGGGPDVGDKGDIAMNAPAARALPKDGGFGIDGTGIRIGIISDSFDAGGANAGAVTSEEANGDLPSAANMTVLTDASSGDDEGRAMAELAHKVAPGAQIYFAALGSGPTASANAIASLEAAGCNVIVDDGSWFIEPFFQDGSVLQSAVETATASGVSYFTSAGNQFSHYYQSTVGALTTQQITINAGGTIDIDMQWTQPFKSIGTASAGSAYSIGWELVPAAGGSPVASSTGNMIGGDPVQNQQFNIATGTYNLEFTELGTVTASDTVKVIVFTGNWSSVSMSAGSGSGTTFGHELVSSANVVGAVDANSPDTVESYSADGPGEIFYNSGGTALVTPIVESTPNFLAPDDIATSVSTWPIFAGTSAAAPDAAAAGALLLQLNPNLTPANLQTVLIETASTTGLSGSAVQEGAGLINVDAAAMLIYDGSVVLSGTTIYNGTSTDHDSVLAWNSGSGNWGSVADWAGSAKPTGTSYVTLGDNLGALTSDYTVTLNTAAPMIATLTVGDAATIATALTIATGGSLSVAGGATVGKSGGVTVTTGTTLGVAGLLRLEDVTGDTAQLIVEANAHISADGLDVIGGSVSIGAGASLIDTGGLNIAEGGAGMVALAGTASVGGGVTLGARGLLTLDTGGRVSAGGTLAGASTSSVEIARSSTLSALALSNGHITIDTGGSLDLSTANSVALFNLFNTTIDVEPGGGTDDLAHVVLSGLTHAASDTVSYSSGFLIVETIDAGTTTDLAFLGFDAAQGFKQSSFSIVSDASGPIEINIACYVSGTRIATPTGEAPVECLRIGDSVLTASGAVVPIRWIGRRSYPAAAVAAERRVRPIRIAAGALAEGLPRRDLLVSQQHALLLRDPRPGDGAREVLVPAVQLVNGVSVTRCDAAGTIAYYHLELASHAVILAEGQPAETFVDRNSRSGFANAGEYALLYPRELAAIVPFCAPRVEGGTALARVRAVINARARLRPGPLQGYIDRVDRLMVEGWAFDPDNPDCPVQLEVVIDGAVIGALLADQYRPDLVAMNGGHCAFYFPIPQAAPGGGVLVRRAGDGCALAGPPCESAAIKPRYAKTGNC